MNTNRQYLNIQFPTTPLFVIFWVVPPPSFIHFSLGHHSWWSLGNWKFANTVCGIQIDTTNVVSFSLILHTLIFFIFSSQFSLMIHFFLQLIRVKKATNMTNMNRPILRHPNKYLLEVGSSLVMRLLAPW